jgi:hypothetical protein
MSLYINIFVSFFVADGFFVNNKVFFNNFFDDC